LSTETIQGPDLDAQQQLREQQENKAHAAQWLPEVPVHNIKEPEVLLICKKSYCKKITHSVSSKNHTAMVEKASQLAIRVINSSASLRSEENE
jgi:ribosomal protein L32E